MLISPRRRLNDEDLAAQLLKQNSGAIMQGRREDDRARMAAATTDGDAPAALSPVPEELGRQILASFGRPAPMSPVATLGAPPASGELRPGVRIGPRPVEEMPPVEARPRGEIKISPRVNPAPPAGSPPPGATPLTNTPPSLTTSTPTLGDTSALPQDIHTRPRRLVAPAPPQAGSVEEAEADLAEASGRKVEDKNGRFMSIILNALHAAGQPFQGGRVASNWNELAGAAGRGIGGGIVGGVKPSVDEQRQKDFDITKRQGELDRRTTNEANRAKIRYTNATAAKAENYEEVEQRKADERAKAARASELNRARNSVLANLRLFKGQKLDASNPTHATLLQRAAEAGVVIDPETWNTSKENVAVIELIDPDNPTQKQRIAFNRVTGEREEIGQSGYAQPVGADGLTEQQRRADADRDASRAATAARFEQTFGLGVDRFKAQLERGMRQDALRAFNVESAGYLPRARAIEREVKDIRKRVREGTARAGELARIPALEAEGAKLAEEFEAVKARALSGATPGTRPAASGNKYTEADVRARARAAGKDADAAVKAARSRGLLKD